MPTCVLSPGDPWLHTSSHHPATPTNGPVTRLAPRFPPTQRCHLSRVPLPPTFNPHSSTASAANASGFLLTALSNARDNTHSHAFCPVRASDKALTFLSRDPKQWQAEWPQGMPIGVSARLPYSSIALCRAQDVHRERLHRIVLMATQPSRPYHC